MNKNILILGLIFLFPLRSFSQYAFVNSHADKIYQDGIELFEQKQYTAAQNKFEDYQNHQDRNKLKSDNAEYYSALISIYLYHSDGEKRIKSFVESHPTHPKASEAYFELGNFYFREKNYAKAIQYFEKPMQINFEERVKQIISSKSPMLILAEGRLMRLCLISIV